MTTLKLDKQLAADLAGMAAQSVAILSAAPIVAVVENRQFDSDRWNSVHELVVKTSDDKLWRAVYEQGLTEYQDTEPFEARNGVVIFTEVKAVPVIAYKYEAV